MDNVNNDGGRRAQDEALKAEREKADREARETMLKETLLKAYLEAGGTETEFKAEWPELRRDAIRAAAVRKANEALTQQGLIYSDF